MIALFWGGLAFLLVQGEPSAAPSPETALRALLDRHLGDLPEARRVALSAELSARVPWSRWPDPKDSGRILENLEGLLTGTLARVSSVESSAKNIAEAIQDSSAAGMSEVPAEFRARAQTIALERLNAYVQEALHRDPVPPAASAVMERQLDQLAGVLREEARRLVVGPQADSLIGRVVEGGVGDFRTQMLDIVGRGAGRPLSEEEYSRVLTDVRERARQFSVVETTPDCLVDAGELDEERRKAVSAIRKPLHALLYELSGWTRTVFPLGAAAGLESAKLNDEISAWHLDLIRRVNARLEPENRDRRRKIEEALARADAKRDAPTGKGEPAAAIAGRPSETAPRTAPPPGGVPLEGSDVGSSRLITVLAVAGAVLAFLSFRWFQKRAESPH